MSPQPRTAAKPAAPALAGKVALVTGAATGIGKAIAFTVCRPRIVCSARFSSSELIGQLRWARPA
jgi:NAD(P)-dependent dehydrogenase (short-subunit alcohol dehydrogenase family)